MAVDPSMTPLPGSKAIRGVSDLIRAMFAADEKRIITSRYSMVICAAGHHLTGEGEPPTECPVCKKDAGYG